MKNIDLKDVRVAGVATMVLMALAMALPWVTVTAPFLGSISVTGYKVGGDGWIFLGAVAMTGVAAFLRLRRTAGWLGLGLALGLIGDYAYNVISVKHEMNAGTDNEFADALMGAVSIAPGIGLVLAVLIAGVLATYALWFLPRTERQDVAGEAEPIVADPEPEVG